MAKMNWVRILLTLASDLHWNLFHFNVKNGFLHGNLEEEVYMDFPLRFEGISNNKRVWKPKKSLYGLKQYPKVWFEQFTKSLREYNFSQSQGDDTLFFKCSLLMKMTILIVSMGYIIVIGDIWRKSKAVF